MNRDGAMMTGMATWDEIEAALRHKVYRTLENDPQILLEQDGGPFGVEADLIYARLIGYEDEIVKDGWRLRSIEPQLWLPITPSARSFLNPDAPPPLDVSRSAIYVLQSGYAVMPVDPLIAPDVLDLLPPGRDWQPVRVLYLRYRRRG